ncbi:hypothetical protein JTB14_036837 [Gonioctena quinquepunctata]|nr:hypothetical protein JTB14_036837 [Gonioctena quinquepunctata]
MYWIRPLLNCGIRRHTYNLAKHFSTKGVPKEDTLNDGPIKFSTSRARTYKASTTRTGQQYEQRLWYEPYVIMASISAFLIYFCILREENDIDAELSTSLYSRIHGLEEVQLKQSLLYNERHGLDTKDIIKRLQEIEEEKANESVQSSS